MNGVVSSVPTTFFRKCENLIRQDAGCKVAFSQIQAYGPHDRSSPTQTPRQSTLLKLFPRLVSEQWESADSHKITLNITSQISLPTTDAGDWLDLWTVLCRVFYPASQATRLALHKQLRDAGAITGEALFQLPQPDASQATSGIFTLTGGLLFDLRWTLNA
jgi:hypothetical protein